MGCGSSHDHAVVEARRREKQGQSSSPVQASSQGRQRSLRGPRILAVRLLPNDAPSPTAGQPLRSGPASSSPSTTRSRPVIEGQLGSQVISTLNSVPKGQRRMADAPQPATGASSSSRSIDPRRWLKVAPSPYADEQGAAELERSSLSAREFERRAEALGELERSSISMRESVRLAEAMQELDRLSITTVRRKDVTESPPERQRQGSPEKRRQDDPASSSMSSQSSHIRGCRCLRCQPEFYRNGQLKGEWSDACVLGCLCPRCLKTAHAAFLRKDVEPCANGGHKLPPAQQCRAPCCQCKIGCASFMSCQRCHPGMGKVTGPGIRDPEDGEKCGHSGHRLPSKEQCRDSTCVCKQGCGNLVCIHCYPVTDKERATGRGIEDVRGLRATALPRIAPSATGYPPNGPLNRGRCNNGGHRLPADMQCSKPDCVCKSGCGDLGCLWCYARSARRQAKAAASSRSSPSKSSSSRDRASGDGDGGGGGGGNRTGTRTSARSTEGARSVRSTKRSEPSRGGGVYPA